MGTIQLPNYLATQLPGSMKSVGVLALLVSTISASIVPIRFNLPGNQQAVLKSVANCEGHDNDVVSVIGGNSPDEVCMPGTMKVDINTLIREDLPMDTVFKLDLQKLEPFPMKVPCVNGIGSCPYDVCPLKTDILCPYFPDNQPCECPLKANTWDMKGVDVPVPDMGPILGKVMEGKYEAKATLYPKSNPDNILGCFALNFRINLCEE